MEHTYIIIANGIAFTVMIVTNDAVGGRYQILSTAYNGVNDEVYDSISDIETAFSSWVTHGIIEAWYPLWNPSMNKLDPKTYETKIKQISRRIRTIDFRNNHSTNASRLYSGHLYNGGK